MRPASPEAVAIAIEHMVNLHEGDAVIEVHGEDCPGPASTRSTRVFDIIRTGEPAQCGGSCHMRVLWVPPAKVADLWRWEAEVNAYARLGL